MWKKRALSGISVGLLLICGCATLGDKAEERVKENPVEASGESMQEISLADKKVLGFAADRVNPSYLRKYVAEIEKLPLDGLLISVFPNEWMGGEGYRNLMWFGGAPFTREDFSQAVADLKATEFKRFTDNFMDFPTTVNNWGFTVGDGELKPHPVSYTFDNVDWFNKGWSKIAENGAVAAYVAREGGLKGLLMDVEPYGGGSGVWKQPFLYSTYRKACLASGVTPRSREECVARIRRRGREFIEAVTAVYPEITIIIIHHTGWTRDSMVEPFVKGMLESRGKATLIDGGEGGYPLITYREFTRLRESAESSHRTDKLLDTIEYAFGVWVDHTPNKYGGWHTDPADFDKNYRSPSELEHTLHGALTAADRYVWLYSWHPQVWYNPHVRRKENLAQQAKQCFLCPHTEIPRAYLDAIRNCRRPHDLDWSPVIKQDRFVYFDDAVLVEGSEISEEPQNLLKNPGMEVWSQGPDKSPDNWIGTGQDPAVLREESIVKSGKCSARLTTTLMQGHVFFDQRIPAEQLAGKTITLGCWIKTDLEETGDLQILDRADNVWEVTGNPYPGGGQWHFVTVTKTIRQNLTDRVRLRLSAHIPVKK